MSWGVGWAVCGSSTSTALRAEYGYEYEGAGHGSWGHSPHRMAERERCWRKRIGPGLKLRQGWRMSAESRLKELNLVLPPAPRPIAVYKPVVVLGNTIYVSGHGPVRTDGTLITGVVGKDLDLEAGKAAARQVGLAILANLKAHFGTLDKVKRVVKTLGMVNTAPDFYDHPKVINGCSELFAEVWGPENGIGARSAVGMGPLPGNIAVEIEVIFELA